MEHLRGQRFTVDFSDDEGDEASSPSRLPGNGPSSQMSAFIGDIKERDAAPPSAPTLKVTPTGFPEHKKRTRVSAFKQQRSGSGKTPSSEPAHAVAPSNQSFMNNPSSKPIKKNSSIDDEERRCIDEENNQRLAAMSAQEIAEERQELMDSLDPSLIQRLLKRANLDHGRGDTGLYPPGESEPEPEPELKPSSRISEEKDEDDAIPAPLTTGKRILASKTVTFEDDEPSNPINLQPASNPTIEPLPEILQPSIHFPVPPRLPISTPPTRPSSKTCTKNTSPPSPSTPPNSPGWPPSPPTALWLIKTPHTTPPTPAFPPQQSASISAAVYSLPVSLGPCQHQKACTTTAKRPRQRDTPSLNSRASQDRRSRRNDVSRSRRWGGYFID